MSTKDLEVTKKINDQNKSEDHLKSSVIQLKEWLAKQNHLAHISISDSFLCNFAAVAKGNHDKACKRLDTYYTVRTLIPEFFSERDPSGEDIIFSAKSTFSGLLPDTTPDGSRVFMFSLMDKNPAAFDMIGYLRRYYMLLDYYFLKNILKPGQGIYFIIDTKGVSIGHVMKFSPSIAKKSTFCSQDVYPIKVAGMIFLNVNDLVKMTINTLLYPLLREKMRKRFQLIGSQMDKLYRIVPKEILPAEYGGNGPSINEINDKAFQDLIPERTWFLTEGSSSSDESKRLEKCPVSLPGCSIM